MKKQLILFFLIALMFYPSIAMSFIVTDFGPATYDPNTAAMDTVLGIAGYTVEDFEDTMLLPGLQISTNTNPTPFSTIEQWLDSTGGRPWDGSFSIHNNNLVPGSGEQKAMSITFHIADGATSFGFGLSDVQSWWSPTHSILVNGSVVVSDLFGELSSLYDFPVPTPPNPPYERTGYIRIDSEASELINTVTFQIDSAPRGTIDGMSIDHVAFNVVPEPLSSTLFIVGGATLGFRRWRKKKTS